MGDFGKVIGCLMWIACIAIALLMFGGILFFTERGVIESPTKITPEIRLTTDGKKIDTIYVYKVK